MNILYNKSSSVANRTAYSPNCLRLLGNNFEELEEVIASSFGRIENKGREQTVYEYPKHHPWGPEQLKQIVHIVPKGDLQSMRLIFPAPYDVEYFRTIVSFYLLI